MSIHTHFYRNLDEVGLTPEQQAIEELQQDVERIDENLEKLDNKIDQHSMKHFVQNAAESKYYVDWINGDDSNDGHNPDLPLKTIDRAFEHLNEDNAGIFIYLIEPGTYTFSQSTITSRRQYLFNNCSVHIYGGYKNYAHGEPGYASAVSRTLANDYIVKYDGPHPGVLFYQCRFHIECLRFQFRQSATFDGCDVYTNCISWEALESTALGTDETCVVIFNGSDYQAEGYAYNLNDPTESLDTHDLFKECQLRLNNGSTCRTNGLYVRNKLKNVDAVQIINNSTMVVRSQCAISPSDLANNTHAGIYVYCGNFIVVHTDQSNVSGFGNYQYSLNPRYATVRMGAAMLKHFNTKGGGLPNPDPTSAGYSLALSLFITGNASEIQSGTVQRPVFTD